MENEKIFADGFIFKRNEKAPDFVVGNMSIKVDEAITLLKNQDKNGWVNLSIKKARSGNYYIEVDQFEPKSNGQRSQGQSQQYQPSKAEQAEAEQVVNNPASDIDDDLPF